MPIFLHFHFHDQNPAEHRRSFRSFLHGTGEDTKDSHSLRHFLPCRTGMDQMRMRMRIDRMDMEARNMCRLESDDFGCHFAPK